MQISISSPAAEGVEASGIEAFLDAIENDGRTEPHGLIIHRHGRRIAEGYWAPHNATRNRLVYSLSKTFTGSALGLEIGEGRLALDDLVAHHLPEIFGDADERTARMTIRNIASMASGHDREMLLEAFMRNSDDPIRGFFQIQPDAEPGSLFAYSQPPVLALASILQRLAGERLVSYLRPRLLDPLGIGDLRWSTFGSPGIDLGFSGVYTCLDAVARLGQLYLDDGVCDGERLLPVGFVGEASRVQIPNPQRDEPDWQQGYGIQLWRSRHGYRGDGAFGQYMVVLPDHDAVIAMFSCTASMQSVLDAMWQHIVPAMGDEQLAHGGTGDAALAGRLGSLRQRTAIDRCGGSAVDGLDRIHLVPGEGLSHPTITSMEVVGDALTIREVSGEFTVPLSAAWSTVEASGVASCATTLPSGQIVVDLAMLATPHRLEITLDPAARTFTALWPNGLVPLFGVGIDPSLGSMRAPAAVE